MNQMQLYDIYGHWHQPFWQTVWFKSICVLAVIALIAGVFIWYFKRYRKVLELPASLTALKALDVLEKRPIHSKEDAQKSYYALTDILKTFFEKTYHVHCTGMSDAEMINALRSTQLPHQLMQTLEKMVDASVQIKYAQHDALQPELMHHIAITKDIIHKII